jgi:DNA primase|tara:strand:+ start:279 stop:1106 length:828 start_codon:yes stop_codon:yes gene_type:complete
MNVEDILIKKGISYIHKGKDLVVKCLDPDHDDSNPSMRIDRTLGIFSCPACKFSGNIFTYFGEKPNHLQLRRERLKNNIRQKMAESSGLVFPENSTRYEGTWRNITNATYKKFEAFNNVSSEFASRVNFPIKDFSGKITAFVGRHTGDGIPKYMISPPGAQLPIFPQVVPKNGCIMLVEGIFDVLNLHDKGIHNAVCCFGIKNMNEEKLQVFRMMGATQIDIFMDGDVAGQEAAERIKELCESVDLTTRNVCFKNTDPGALTINQVQKLAIKLYS